LLNLTDQEIRSGRLVLAVRDRKRPGGGEGRLTQVRHGRVGVELPFHDSPLPANTLKITVSASNSQKSLPGKAIGETSRRGSQRMSSPASTNRAHPCAPTGCSS
jgi:hypothetical protein